MKHRVFSRFILGIVLLYPHQLQADHLFHYDFPPLNSPVGTVELSVIDHTRKDPHDEKLQRELPIRVWYPAIDNKEIELAEWGYTKRDFIIEKASDGAPMFIVEMVYQGQVRSKPNLSPRAGSYPSVFLLHGLGGGPIEEHTDLAETLASQGFVVIGVNFPFGAAISKISQSAEPIGPSQKLTEILSRYPASKPELITYRKDEHKLWVEDIGFVLSQLKTRKEPPFSAIDWSRVHMVGHSHGGMVALESCLKEPSCKSSVNMDGWTYELEFPHDLKPHLVMYTLSSGDYFRSFCKDRLNCVQREIAECDIAHGGFSDKAYIKWPFTHYTNNQCGSKSVEVKQQINQEIGTFLKTGS